MRSFGLIRKFVVVPALMLVPASSFAAVAISVSFAPPALPVYTQPACPGNGYLWTPGYWSYAPTGYYWVPGVWVQPPSSGLLWTPGYWGASGSSYTFHDGYWGSHVGFYGGVNYGSGYSGSGFSGGRWAGGNFSYNTAVSNVNTTIVHNTYVDRTAIVNHGPGGGSRVSYNGGTGGLQTRATVQETTYSRETRVSTTVEQQNHVQTARNDRSSFASVNGGRPSMAAARTTNEYHTTVTQRTTVAQAQTQHGGFAGQQGANLTQVAQNNRSIGGRPTMPGGRTTTLSHTTVTHTVTQTQHGGFAGQRGGNGMQPTQNNRSGFSPGGGRPTMPGGRTTTLSHTTVTHTVTQTQHGGFAGQQGANRGGFGPANNRGQQPPQPRGGQDERMSSRRR